MSEQSGDTALPAGSVVGMEVLQTLNIPIDIITFSFIVYNFAVVGVLVTFFMPAPLILKQGALVQPDTRWYNLTPVLKAPDCSATTSYDKVPEAVKFRALAQRFQLKIIE